MDERESQEREYGRVLQSSVETRMRSIQEKISLAFTFCSTVQCEIQYGDLDRASEMLRKLYSTVEVLTGHINNRAHVPVQQSDEFRKSIGELRKQLLTLEFQIEQH